MINVLMCVYKSGDVLGLTLQQLVEVPEITRILIADGPHLGPIKPGAKVDHPTVKEVVDGFGKGKIFYQYTDDQENRARKNNHILPRTTKDCEWILNVDSDEVYHEDHLRNLVEFIQQSPEFDRYKIKTINPHPDFHHEFRIPDWKPRLYKYKKGFQCPDSDRCHQYVYGDGQKTHPTERRGMAFLPAEICQIYHLNALRAIKHNLPLNKRRVKDKQDGNIGYKGGNQRYESEIYSLDINEAPRCIRELKRDNL